MKLPLWLSIILIGFALDLISFSSFVITGNLIIFPTVILLSSFLIPIGYAAFFFSHDPHPESSIWDRLIFAFFFGGLLGILAVSFIEPLFIKQLNFFNAFEVGLIEEFGKILGVIAVSRLKKHGEVKDGIIVGVTTGIGFAAFESIGYAFIVFITNQGNLLLTLVDTIVRSLLSPIGHATWTGILAGFLYRESKGQKFRITEHVLIAYLFVSVLHGLWDGLPIIFSFLPVPSFDYVISALIVAVIGVSTLTYLWQKY